MALASSYVHVASTVSVCPIIERQDCVPLVPPLPAATSLGAKMPLDVETHRDPLYTINIIITITSCAHALLKLLLPLLDA